MNADHTMAPFFNGAAPRPDYVLVTAFLEAVPDYVYFKDRDSRFIAASRSKAQRNGCSDPAELIGKTDADFFAEEHAQWSRVDEENIMNTGVPVVGKLEKTVWLDGREGWAEATKLPLRDETGDIIGTFGITQDVTERERIQHELEKARRELVDASHLAGMAEVATGVLHNVGNVLTSVNVSANMIGSTLAQSRVESLEKLAALLQAHEADLDTFITQDPKGRRVPEFLESLGRHMLEERDKLMQEVASLQQNIDHIKEIVTMQQAYATMAGVTEPLDAAVLMEDAVRMNAGALIRHDVAVVREFQPAPAVVAEKAKVLQILVNLIRNAKYACDTAGHADKTITLRVEPGAADRVRLVVQDNGIGIPAENLPRIFEHGFTTRAGGHGFGLHSAIVAAQEMQGTLTAESAGPGLGATFTLELPAASSDTLPANAYSIIAR